MTTLLLPGVAARGRFDDLTDITYHHHVDDATVRVAFNNPEVRSVSRPHTVDETVPLDHARMSPGIRSGAADRPSPGRLGVLLRRRPTNSWADYQYASLRDADLVDNAPAPAGCILENCSG